MPDVLQGQRSGRAGMLAARDFGIGLLIKLPPAIAASDKRGFATKACGSKIEPVVPHATAIDAMTFEAAEHETEHGAFPRIAFTLRFWRG